MKLILLTIFSIMCISQTYAQQWEWLTQVNGAANDYTSDIFIDDSGYIYTTGRNKEAVTFTDQTNPVTPVNYGHTDAFVTKYTADGELVWARLIGGDAPDWGWGVAVDNTGNVFYTGEFSDTATFGADTYISNGDRDVFISKLDKDGNFLWTVTFGSTGTDKGRAIDVDKDGYIYATGFMNEEVQIGDSLLGTPGVMNAFIVKLDQNGNFIHQDDIQPDVSMGLKIEADGNGYIYLCGELLYDNYVADYLVTGATTLSWRDGFIAKLDTALSTQWVNTMKGSLQTGAESLSLTEGFVYVTGYYTWQTDFNGTVLTYNGIGSGSTGINAARDAFVAKYSNQGDLVWVKGFGGSSYDYGYGIDATEQDVYFCGVFEDTVWFDGNEHISAGAQDQFICRLDSSGNVIWTKQHSGTSAIYAYAVGLDTNSNLYVGGMYDATSVNFDTITLTNTQFDAYMGKLTQHTYPSYNVSDLWVCEGDTVKITPSAITTPISYIWDSMDPSGWQDGDSYCFVAQLGATSITGALIASNNIYSDTININESLNVVSLASCTGSTSEITSTPIEWNYMSEQNLLSVFSENQVVKISVYSVNGSMVYSNLLKKGKNVVFLGQLNSGIYIISLQDEHGYVENSKLYVK